MPNYRIELANNNIISLRQTRSIIVEDYTQVHDGKLLFAIVSAASEDEARMKIEKIKEGCFLNV